MPYSVVVPVYNKRPHLRRAVLSVLSQRVGTFELIVVDDASTDASLGEISDLYDPRIKRLRRDEPGPGGYAARNLGIAEARGDWVAFLDADDEWAPGFLAEVSALRERFPEARCACTAYWDVSDTGEPRLCSFARSLCSDGPRLIGVQGYVKSCSRGLLPIRTSAFAAERQLLEEIGAFPAGRAKRGGDNDTFFRAMRRTSLAWSPKPCATYYRNAVNMTTNISRPNFNPCIDESIRVAIEGTPRLGEGARLRHWLKRYANHEKKAALKEKIRAGNLTLGDFRRLYASAEPFYAAWILFCAAMPRGSSRIFVQAYKRAKAGFRAAIRRL